MLFDVWIGVEKHTFKANQWTCPNDWIETTGVLGAEMEEPEPSGLFLRSMKTTQAGCLGKGCVAEGGGHGGAQGAVGFGWWSVELGIGLTGPCGFHQCVLCGCSFPSLQQCPLLGYKGPSANQLCFRCALCWKLSELKGFRLRIHR